MPCTSNWPCAMPTVCRCRWTWRYETRQMRAGRRRDCHSGQTCGLLRQTVSDPEASPGRAVPLPCWSSAWRGNQSPPTAARRGEWPPGHRRKAALPGLPLPSLQATVGTEILAKNLSTLNPPGSRMAPVFSVCGSRKTVSSCIPHFTSVQFLDVHQFGIGTVTFARPRQGRSKPALAGSWSRHQTHLTDASIRFPAHRRLRESARPPRLRQAPSCACWASLETVL